MSLDIFDREEVHAINKGYGAMQAALELIRDMPRLYGKRASSLAKQALVMAARFEREARETQGGVVR